MDSVKFIPFVVALFMAMWLLLCAFDQAGLPGLSLNEDILAFIFFFKVVKF